MITYDDATHTYLNDGKKWPSVTQVMQCVGLSDYSHIPEHVLRYAAERGTIVHAMTEMIDDNDLDMDSVMEELRGYADAYTKFLDDHTCYIPYSEEMVYSKKLRYCGRLDRVIRFADKRNYIVDLKCTSSQLPAHRVQLAAYKHAWEEMGHKIDGAKSLYLRGDGTYNIVDHSNITSSEMLTFVSALNVWWWKERNDLNKG